MENNGSLDSCDEEGSTTVFFAALSGALMLLAVFFISAGLVMSAKAQLQAVADLAALSAADASPVSAALAGAPVSGCAIAGEVSKTNGAELRSCDQSGLDVYVVVEKPLTTLVMPVLISAKARAGPPDY